MMDLLSYELGIRLANAIDPRVMMNIDVSSTRSGDATKTIVIESHSDGVEAGSGTIANSV